MCVCVRKTGRERGRENFKNQLKMRFLPNVPGFYCHEVPIKSSVTVYVGDCCQAYMLHVEMEFISPRITVASRKNLSHSLFEKLRKFDNFMTV